MTGNEIFKQAMQLNGYDFKDKEKFIGFALTFVNQIYCDLHYATKNTDFMPLESLENEISLPHRVLCDILPYGVAMLFAENVGDGTKQQLFSMKYNSKRAGLTVGDKVKDVMPAPI